MPVARTGSRPGDTSYRISVTRRCVVFTRRAPAGELGFATRTWRNGRRKGLKIPWEISREGSSPSVRTSQVAEQRAGRWSIRNKRNKDSGDRIDEFGSYTGPSIMAIAAIIGIVALILFYSSSPRVGVLSVAVFLLAIVGVAALMQRLSS